jgi:branched-subunit amino acid transport protein
MLTAILISSLFVAHGGRTAPDVAGIVGVVCAFVAVRRTRNVGFALLVGFPAYWAAAALISIGGP